MVTEFGDGDGIQVYPVPETLNFIKCGYCGGNEVKVSKLIYQGLHVLCVGHCRGCGYEILHTLPVGHDMLFASCFSLEGELLSSYSEPSDWLVEPLKRSLFNNDKSSAAIEVIKYKNAKEAILVNCLDNCFGHAYTKLWNVGLLLDKYNESNVIVLLPAQMKWLVPHGVGEIWLVHETFKKMASYLVELEEKVLELQRRTQKIYLANTYTHLASEAVNFKALLKTEPFNVNEFYQRPPLITFILREDRLWHRFAFEYFLYKLFYKLNWPKAIFVKRQHYLVKRLIKKLKKALPELQVAVTGVGNSVGLDAAVKDLRKNKLTQEDELEWCKLYGQSQLVIGVHGSNMLIPTSLSAGFIEILPRHKIRHIAEDTVTKGKHRYALFLSRHVDHYASVNLLATHVLSIFKDFKYVYKNAEENI